MKSKHIAIAVLFQLSFPLTVLHGAELAGNADVDSAQKIENMNKSVHKSLNVNDDKGTRLLVLFDPGSVEILPAFKEDLRLFAAYLATHPKATADIFGRSDQVGIKPMPNDIGQKRADAVKRVLVVTYGIQESRLIAKGYEQIIRAEGDTSVADKQMNRRVYAIIKEPR